MRLNRSAITPTIQKAIIKGLNLNSAKLRQYKTIAGKSDDKHFKFLISTKLLKGNMTESQVTEALTKLSEVTNDSKLRNAKSSLRSILGKIKQGEIEQIEKERKAKLVEKSVQYRKNLRKQLNADENPLVKTTGPIYKTASQMSGANNTTGSNQGEKASVTINTTGSNEGTKAAEKQASAQNVSSPKTPPSLPQMPLD